MNAYPAGLINNFPGKFIYNPTTIFISNDSENKNAKEQELFSEIKLPKGEPFFVMLVDDDSDDRFFFSEVVKQLHANIKLECAEDGNDLMNVLSIANKPLPHLIFLDLNMPNKNGKECLEEIRNNETLKNIPIVIYSTSTSPKDIDETYTKGANLYVSKPSSFNELMIVVRKVLSLNWDKYKPHALKSNFLFSSKTN